MASAGSTRSASRIDTRLASTQMPITVKKAMRESPGTSNTYLGNSGAEKVAAILPTTKPISPSASAPK